MLDLIKIPFPFRIITNIINKCNLDCLYCSNKEFNNDDLDYAEWEIFFKKISKINISSIILSGGEPLCYKNIENIIDLLIKLNIRVNLITNGTLLKNYSDQFIKKLTAIQISYDGKKFNKVYRNIESNNILEGVKRCRQLGVKVYSMTVITSENVYHIEETINEVKDFVDICSFERVSIVGNARKNKYLNLTKEQEKLFLHKIQKLTEKYKFSIEINCNDPIQNCKYVMDNGNIISGCAIGLSTLCINSNGDIIPCTRLPLILGNIKKDDIYKLWNTSDVLNKIRSRELKGKCGICNCKYICGGCRASAWSKFNDYLEEDPECYL